MKGFIINFFGCTDCASNFRKEISNLETAEFPHNNDAILFLWKVHNSVNRRLRGDVTEDVVHPKLQFPTRQNCRSCYTTDNQFITDKVLEFLKQIYSAESIVKDSKRLLSETPRIFNAKDPQRRRDFEKFSLERLRHQEKLLNDLSASVDVRKRSDSRLADVATALAHSTYIGLNSFDVCFGVLCYSLCCVFILVIYLRLVGRCSFRLQHTKH